MKRFPFRHSTCFLFVAGLAFISWTPCLLHSADLPGFKTPETARTSRIDAYAGAGVGKMGFLGISADVNAGGKLIVADVAPNSPALKAGVATNDVIVRIDGQSTVSPDAFRKSIQSKSTGQSVKLSLLRAGKPVELTATLASLATVGRPIERVRLGVLTGETRAEGGERIDAVDADSAAAKAGLKTGDWILKINNLALNASTRLADALLRTGTNDTIILSVLRDGKNVETNARLAALNSPNIPVSGRGGGPAARRGTPPFVQKNTLKLAVLVIEYPDVKHNEKITTKDWEQEFFSTKSYNRTATGQPAYGSVNDFYSEQASGLLHVEGKVFDWIQASRNRMDYTNSAARNGVTGPGSRDGLLLNEVLDKFVAREGTSVLDDYDAVIFLYAGRRAVRDIGNVYWPHSSSTTYKGRRIRYFIGEEGGNRMTDISLMCHEFGHVLGLPDLYIRRPRGGGPNTNSIPTTATSSPTNSVPAQAVNRNANPYAQSLGNWEVMAVQARDGRPQHMSAWSKERLGWLTPTVIDPTIRQKLVLSPVENSTNQCFKIPVRPDGSEYFLLENRRHIGFDASYPAEGLMIWRVVYGRPILEMANGSTNLRNDVRNIPFPTDKNDSFTPYTKPSSAALTGDELPVYITNIRRLPDGKISFCVGYGFD